MLHGNNNFHEGQSIYKLVLTGSNISKFCLSWLIMGFPILLLSRGCLLSLQLNVFSDIQSKLSLGESM